jgi:hypothetical protein
MTVIVITVRCAMRQSANTRVVAGKAAKLRQASGK